MKKSFTTLVLAGISLICTVVGSLISDKKSEIEMEEKVAKEVEKQLTAREAKEEVVEES